jgi:preprotein translocase subunit SecA
MTLFCSKNEKKIKYLQPILESVNKKENWAKALEAKDFPLLTIQFRKRYASGESLDSLLPEAFAMVREAAWRNLGERPYDVQVMGSIVLHQGKIAELKNGEGKTLMVVAAAYLNAIPGKGVHVVTTNDYLVKRDADWMRPIFDYLGLTVGTILSDMDNDQRRNNYACDITYGTNNEFGFDYLRDNMCRNFESRVQHGRYYCIIDEIDTILIDEARTPLIITETAENNTFKVAEVDHLSNYLAEVQKNKDGEYPDEVKGEDIIGDYKLNEKNKDVSLTNSGQEKIEKLLKNRALIEGSIDNEENFEYIHYFKQALRAYNLYHINVDYVVQNGQVQIVDEFTGRIRYGSRYSDGLHQAIEAKERIKIAQWSRTIATITFQNYFRLYEKISGGTGTADTEAVEFSKIYDIDVVVIPTHRPIARLDEDDVVYLNENDKYVALCNEITEVNKRGQPILVGTVSIEKSEKISNLLTYQGVHHEVLNAKNHNREAAIIAEAGAKSAVTIATNMAGRGTDIKLGGNVENRARKRAAISASPEQYAAIYGEEYEKWKKDYEEVKSLGGLYVIGTERHESRRIDNQLRGRSGRQGDPGKSKFFISMDDELMRLFGGERMKSVMSKIGMEGGDPIYHPWLNKSIENAQKKVEERNFEIRKHLLEYDDVLNQQRKFIYEQRDSILEDRNLKERVNSTTDDMVSTWLDNFRQGQRQDPATALKELSETLKNKFNYIIDASNYEFQKVGSLEERICAELKEDIEAKERIIGPEYLNFFISEQYLKIVDRKWSDHLEELESLRNTIHLRSYAQKNPLAEYKVEGFQLFEKMIDNIRQEIASRLHFIRIQVAPTDETRRPASRTFTTAQSASHVAW